MKNIQTAGRFVETAVTLSANRDIQHERSKVNLPRTDEHGMRKGLLVSFAIHVVVIAVAIILFNGNVRKQQETITVLLTDGELLGGENKAGISAPARFGVRLASPPTEKQSSGPRNGRTEHAPAAIPRTMAPSPQKPEADHEVPKMTMTAVGESLDASQTSSSIQPAGLAVSSSLGGGGVVEGRGSASGAGIGTGDGSGTGHGTGTGMGDGEGGLKRQYMERHFAYIRDLILKNLKYPPLAQRMGWKGTVTVSFVVLENGAAENIRIAKSSGREVLDQAVIKTIQGIQPFPSPPVRAELVIPIAFRLE